VPYSSTKLYLIPNLKKIRYGHEKLVYNRETQQYIELRFSQNIFDYDAKDKEKEELFDARECTE
jgi:hypothetical protein